MQYRMLGRTGWKVSGDQFWGLGDRRRLGLGGGHDSLAALHRAVDLGVNFFDTADVYGDGHSERLLAQLKRERREEIISPPRPGGG